jgi:hypothetical protein
MLLDGDESEPPRHNVESAWKHAKEMFILLLGTRTSFG